MRLLHISQQFPGIIHSQRSAEVSSASLRRLLTSLSGVLVIAVLLETVLFRMFARTGIYLFQDDTPRWVFQAYSAAVWFGNTMFNFAALLSVMLFAFLAGYLWMRRNISGRSLPILVAVMVPWNVALFFTSAGTLPILIYLAASLALIVASTLVLWGRSSAIVRVTFALLVASFLAVYYFETIAPLRQAGVVFSDRGITIFQIGEALAGAAIVTAFVAWGRTRSLKLIALPALAGILMAGSYFSMPDRFPLISTWALGVTMSMPFLLYALGLTLLGITLIKLVASGRPLIAYGLALLYFSHRMLPLTYFNMLILIGFVLITIALTERGVLKDEAGIISGTA